MKILDEAGFRKLLRDEMTIGIGGFGLDRKPMLLIDWLASSGTKGHSLQVFAGGIDVEILVAAGVVARVAANHVGLDHLGLAPRFRAAREQQDIRFEEWSESTMLAALRAGAEHLPFATVALDPATDLRKVNPKIATIASPFDGTPATVVAALRPELALLHAEAIHPDGWVVGVGDTFVDDLLARAADRVVVSAERLIDDDELQRHARDVRLLDSWVDHVVVAPMGARPGSCQPLYPIDFEAVLPFSIIPEARIAR